MPRVAISLSIPMYVIYADPSDAPGRLVVREMRVIAGRVLASVEPAYTGGSLEIARSVVPDGWINLGRRPDDEPQIKEVWTTREAARLLGG